MKTVSRATQDNLPSLQVEVVEPERSSRPGYCQCKIGFHVSFDMSRMESFFFAKWDPVIHDAFLVAAAVEFCDMAKPRPKQGWGRHFEVRVPVHDPERWMQDGVSSALREALEFLTCDHWSFEFYGRKKRIDPPWQGFLNLDRKISAVIPFSDGLDSFVAAKLAGQEFGKHLALVNLGKKNFAPNNIRTNLELLTTVPYRVRRHSDSGTESSARSRGFKFALISGIAAYLAGAEKIIVPESGQGVLGSYLITVGHAYPDYRSHPSFGRKMEVFLRSLLDFNGHYDYPYIWNTKGEILSQFIKISSDSSAWKKTRSCWKQNRQVGVNGKARQCGICAACMLRRLSVHAAGQIEPGDTYVWENLGAKTFREGATPYLGDKKTVSMNKDAIAGALYLDHLAALLKSPANKSWLELEYFCLKNSLNLPLGDVKKNLEHLLTQHKNEWEEFMASLGPDAFVVKWMDEVRS